MTTNHLSLSREEIYARVWATPTTTLAAEFGVSDVALAKTCRRKQVPLPPRGYWARKAASQTVKPTPLPPFVEVVRAPKPLPTPEEPPASKEVVFPLSSTALHTVAREVRTALMAATPDTEGILSVRSQSFPEVQVSKACIDHAARALHFILMSVEARGVEFRRARSKYDVAYFEKSGTRLKLSITEAVVTTKREPTAEEKRRPSWEWMLHSRGPCGRLPFRIDTGEGY